MRFETAVAYENIDHGSTSRKRVNGEPRIPETPAATATLVSTKETFSLFPSELFSKTASIPIRGVGPQPVKRAKFLALQRWKGVVLSIREDVLTVRLFDLTHAKPEIEAEIPLDEIARAQIDLVKPGAPFYWTIGYLDIGGTRRRESTIYFRHLPVWTEKELEKAKRKAREIEESVDWE